MSENLQEKQPQNNGKRLLMVILIAFAWLLFVVGLLFTSSKCAKATDYYFSYTGSVGYSSSMNNRDVWTDGINYYYSSNSTQLINNSSTYAWSTKTWTGLTNFSGRDVWTDGTNYYYSNGSSHYQLDTSTSTWSTKTWTGLTNFIGRYVWTDGTNYYYSNNNVQYVLDTSTSTWSTKTWTGLTSFTGDCVWVGNSIVYYSNNNVQRVLDTSTSTWSTKTWTNLSSFSAGNLHISSIGIFYSASSGSGVVSMYYNDDFIDIQFMAPTLTMYWYYCYDSILTNVSNTLFKYYAINTSGGGYTQEDLDEAYDDGYDDGVAYADGRVNVFSSSYGAGVTYGQNSVINNPNDYNLYTQNQYNVYGFTERTAGYNQGVAYADGRVNTSSASYAAGYSAGEATSYDTGYAAGQLDALNYASSTEYGTGRVYPVYGDNLMSIEMSNAYSKGQLDLLNEVADFQYGGSGTDYNSYSSGDMFSTGGVSNLDNRLPELNGCPNGGELCKIYESGRYSGSQYVLNHLGIYQLYTYQEINALVSQSRLDSMLEVLNYISASDNGSGIEYSSFTYSSVDYELSYIYSAGVDYGADSTYQGAYTAGFDSGQNSVTSNPNLYDLYTLSDYNSYGATRYSAGYSAGYTAGNESDDNSLPKVIVSIASVPYTVLSSMFNFNVLGLNIFVFVTSLISLVVVIWVIKKLWK